MQMTCNQNCRRGRTHPRRRAGEDRARAGRAEARRRSLGAVWQKSRDDVAAMLEDMTIAELSLARIALAKIRNERTQRAA